MNRETQNLLFKLALLAGGAYAVYWFFTSGLKQIASGAANAITNAGAAVGGGLYEFWHPGAEGESLFYTVRFPNGAQHSVASSNVSSNGQFSLIVPPYTNQRWQIVIDKVNRKIALPI